MMGTRQTRVQSASEKVTGPPNFGQLTPVPTSVAQIILDHLYNQWSVMAFSISVIYSS